MTSRLILTIAVCAAAGLARTEREFPRQGTLPAGRRVQPPPRNGGEADERPGHAAGRLHHPACTARPGRAGRNGSGNVSLEGEVFAVA